MPHQHRFLEGCKEQAKETRRLNGYRGTPPCRNLQRLRHQRHTSSVRLGMQIRKNSRIQVNGTQLAMLRCPDGDYSSIVDNPPLNDIALLAAARTLVHLGHNLLWIRTLDFNQTLQHLQVSRFARNFVERARPQRGAGMYSCT
jgi:hypothetical protein